jgi:hypothetical protein
MSRFAANISCGGAIVRKTLLISVLALALSPLTSAAAEEQSWSKRTPPPVKFAPPPPEQKQDWSGIYVGVNGGTAVSPSGRGSGVPGSSALPK